MPEFWPYGAVGAAAADVEVAHIVKTNALDHARLRTSRGKVLRARPARARARVQARARAQVQARVRVRVPARVQAPVPVMAPGLVQGQVLGQVQGSAQEPAPLYRESQPGLLQTDYPPHLRP